MASPNPILDLKTLTSRQQVRIDGRLYELRSPDELSLLAYRQHAARFVRLGALLQKKSINATESKEQAALLDGLCRLILDAPPQVHARLHDGQRLQIAEVFSRLLRTRRTARGPRASTTRSATRSRG